MSYQVTKRGQVIEFTVREFELLLSMSPTGVFPDLAGEIWDTIYGDIRTVMLPLAIAEKIEDDPGNPTGTDQICVVFAP